MGCVAGVRDGDMAHEQHMEQAANAASRYMLATSRQQIGRMTRLVHICNCHAIISPDSQTASASLA
jgi:hypothetical protein